jgi:hypothetical protein
MTLQEFYGETLKAAGYVPPADEIAKVAESRKIDLETVKMARSIYEQLQLDGVKYANEEARLDDSLKIAEAYVAHVKDNAAAAEKLAGDLHRVARHAVEGYLAQHGIELDADEGVKIAGLQAVSFQELTQKQAALRQLDIKAEELKTASEIPKVAFNTYKQVPGGQMADPSLHDPAGSAAAVATHFGGDPAVHGPVINQLATNAAGGEANLPAYYDALHAHAMKNPGTTFAAAHQAVMAGAQGAKPQGLMARPGLMLGAGALGLGALYMMRKRKQEAENRQRSMMGAAAMPTA